MARSDKVTVARRIQEVFKLLVAGAEFSDIKEYANGHGWNVTVRQLQRYIRQANKLFAKVVRKDHQQLLGRHIMQRRAMFARSIKANNLNTALRSLQDEAKLQGIYPPTKIASTTPDGQQSYFGMVDSPLNRRERLTRMLQAEARQDKVEQKLMAQITPVRVFRLPDTQLPLMMLNLLALAYVNQQLEFSMTYLHAVFCATVDEIGRMAAEDAETLDDLSWDAIAQVFAHRFRVGEVGWGLFMQKLGLEPDHLMRGNYHGCMLQLAREALPPKEVSEVELLAICESANCSRENLVTPEDVCRGWQRQLSTVL